MSYQLCDQCCKLELCVDRFKVGNDAISNTISLQQSWRPSTGSLVCDTFKEIEARAPNCSLCNIIVAAIPPEVRLEINPSSTTCRLVWELDGRDSLEPASRKRTRRLRIRWNQERLKAYEAYLVLAAPSCYDESNLDYPRLLNEETQFLGRRIGPVVNKRNLIREFLRLCETHHDERCTGKLGIEHPFAETLKQSYFGVIDIHNQNLVPLPYRKDKDYLAFQPYATVSYVWGNSRDHRTTLSNIQDRLKSGGLAETIETLPVALKQSISLISGMGIRYIWIDSLCIIQNSSHSWNLNSRTMHLIYGNSTLTICSADGTSAEAGLQAINEKYSVEQHIAKVAPDVHLVLHQSPESNIEDSMWNRRAWTFQERLLSRRCLIFTKGQVYFQCRSTGMSEDIFVEKNGKGWSLDLNGAPLQTLMQLKQRALWFYTNCVGLYTKRELYEPFDILAAFNGMCKLIEGTLSSPFTFGMPTSHFDFALLWQPNGKSSLLKRPVSEEEKYKNMKFPSWSWCGWKSEGVMYKHQMIEGCHADVRAWLRDHTWIDWHIRDGYGTPQRLWDNAWAKEDQSAEKRWRGYCGRNNSKKNSSGNGNGDRGRAGDSDSVESNYMDRSAYQKQYHRRAKSNASNTSNSESEDEQNYGRSRTVRDRLNRIRMPQRRSRRISRSPINYRPPHLRGDENLTDSDRHRRRGIRWDREDEGVVVIRERPRSPPDRFGRPEVDPYGRPLEGSARANAKNSTKIRFKLTLPEYPFHVPAAESKCRDSAHREFPDLPILQFFTWSSELHIATTETDGATEMNEGTLTNGVPSEMDAQSKTCEGFLKRYYILDQRGDKCGSIVMDSEWLTKQPLPHQFQFIAISEAKSFTTDEMPEWTYYIPKERVESEWDIYFVLLIEYYPDEGLWRRVALGKVFKMAFSHDEDTWKEIVLG